MRWNLAESLLLLALDDLEGTVRGGFPLDVGLAAAELTAAAQHERIKVGGGRIEVLCDTPTGDADLDGILPAIARHARTHRRPILLCAWLERRRGAVRAAYLSRLVRAGAVSHTRRRMLGLIRVDRFPMCDFEATAEPWRRLADGASNGWRDPDAAALAALVHITGLDRFLYPGRSGAQARETFRTLAQPGRAPEPLAAILDGAAYQIEASVTAAAQTCR
jgi:Golgi phosphoprotein 3 GPP34